MGGGGRHGMGDGEGARPSYTNVLGSGEFMSVGITNFLNVEQLWTCSSYRHAWKNVTALQVQNQMPLSQIVQRMCVTADRSSRKLRQHSTPFTPSFSVPAPSCSPHALWILPLHNLYPAPPYPSLCHLISSGFSILLLPAPGLATLLSILRSELFSTQCCQVSHITSESNWSKQG